ncbi:MAG: NAD(P)-dependent oxidoreductase [Endozoicomonas sp. (ex Botrylloides leachii)]|nr:NAD(P)-dependent oxidoreductase [Endozoicomonas sp. (ex Botrylloides leachii)]
MLEKLSVGFIGLGVMGYPMAAHLSQHYKTVVYNRTIERAQRWVSEYTGTIAITPAQVATEADIIFCCVGNDNDLKEVTLGDVGAFSTMRSNSIFIDHTTTSAEMAREIGKLAEKKGFGFIDAPVSGGQIGAENGQLTIMCGGQPSNYARIAPIMACYAKNTRLMGPIGSGQLTKMVNQICITGVIQGLSEGLHFAQKAGLDEEAVIDVISKGAAQSWQMENRYKTMLTGDYNHGFAVDWMRKDLSICLKEAEQTGAALPVTALVDQFYKDVQSMGGNRWDTSSLLARLQAISQIHKE